MSIVDAVDDFDSMPLHPRDRSKQAQFSAISSKGSRLRGLGSDDLDLGEGKKRDGGKESSDSDDEFDLKKDLKTAPIQEDNKNDSDDDSDFFGSDEDTSQPPSK